MDLGLGNLADVKNFVLPPLQLEGGETQYDAVLSITAAGIADRFQDYCNRQFSRRVGEVTIFGARHTEYFLPRFPVEAITALEMRSTATDAWADIASTIVQEDLRRGWIYFGCCVGDPICQLRCTYTGGFFYETLEPLQADGTTPTPGYPTAAPAGSAPVPPSLKQAWLFQTLHEFQAKDRLLPQGLKEGGSRHDLRYEQMQLLPEVQSALAQYRRYAILP